MEEKKQIKISLGVFYVLVSAMVILLGATISGWLLVIKQNNNQQLENKTEVAMVRTI